MIAFYTKDLLMRLTTDQSHRLRNIVNVILAEANLIEASLTEEPAPWITPPTLNRSQLMPRRYRIPLLVQELFRNLPLESGRTDADIVRASGVPHKTFARLRIHPPTTVTCDQLLLIARLAQRHTPFSSADILAAVRAGQFAQSDSLWALATASTHRRTVKELEHLSGRIDALARDAKRIYLFDDADSFPYLRPPKRNTSSRNAPESPHGTIANPQWPPCFMAGRFKRRPRVRVTLTAAALRRRAGRLADEGVEHLIDNVESGEHSLTFLKEDPRLQHRICRGVFADAAAVAVFDKSVMVVLPSHARVIRIYDARLNPAHATLIQKSIRQLARMRRFRVHTSKQTSVVAHLHQFLTYHIPSIMP
jgi:hypothetical protein